MTKKNLVLIKFGGSLITDKEKPYEVNRKIIKKLVTDFKSVLRKSTNTTYIIGNGAGSFGHYAATIFDYHKPFGFAYVQQKVKELNSILIDELLKHKIPAVSIPFSSVSTAKNKNLHSVYLDSLFGFLNDGIVPVVYGDVIYDVDHHAAIFSTEKIFSILVSKLKNQYSITKVIHVTTVEGFLDENKKVIPYVTKSNYPLIKKNLSKTVGFDVTGGMVHKVEESLALTSNGIATHIISGRIDNVLERLLINNEGTGTVIASK